MKKALLSPLCSGLIIPGLGQVMNQELKKGIGLLVLVFFLFISTLIKLYLILHNAFKAASASGNAAVVDRLAEQDLSLVWLLITAFVMLWLYSILDAYVTGRKLDRLGEGDRP